MSLARTKELAKAGADGSIRPDELRELWALLPAVIEALEAPSFDKLCSNAAALVNAETGESFDATEAKYALHGGVRRTFAHGLVRGYALGIMRWKPREPRTP